MPDVTIRLTLGEDGYKEYKAALEPFAAAGTLGKEASERAIVDIAAKHGLSAHDTKDLKRHRKVNGREAIG